MPAAGGPEQPYELRAKQQLNNDTGNMVRERR